MGPLAFLRLGSAFRVSILLVIFLGVSCGKVSFDAVPSLVQSTNNNIPPLSCNVGNNGPALTRTYPTNCLVDPGLPSNSLGFEMNNLEKTQITLNANDAVNGTHGAANLYIEIATYLEPDTIVINALSASGVTTPLLYICNYSTASFADPTQPQGKVRPYSDTILQFNVTLPVGTVSVSVAVDQNTPYNSGSPTYIGIWNLNEFSTSISSIPVTGLGTNNTYNFRPMSAPLSKYNDAADPNNSSYPNYCTTGP